MTTTLHLYGARTGNCLRAAIALEEARIAYDVKRIDLMQGQHREPAYLALNHRGQVPVLVIRRPGENPFLLTQSNAILLYAADRSQCDLLPAAASIEARARVYERFLYFVTDVIAPNNAAFLLRRAAGAEEGVALMTARSLEALRAAERFLEQDAFMAGEHFTLADIAAYTVTAASKEALDWHLLPRMRAWFELVGSRPGVQRGMSAFDEPATR